MGQLELALQMRSTLSYALIDLAPDFTRSELDSAEKSMAAVTTAVQFNNPLAAIMEMMHLVGTLRSVENVEARDAVSEIAARLRRFAGYSA